MIKIRTIVNDAGKKTAQNMKSLTAGDVGAALRTILLPGSQVDGVDVGDDNGDCCCTLRGDSNGIDIACTGNTARGIRGDTEPTPPTLGTSSELEFVVDNVVEGAGVGTGVGGGVLNGVVIDVSIAFAEDDKPSAATRRVVKIQKSGKRTTKKKNLQFLTNANGSRSSCTTESKTTATTYEALKLF